MKINVKGDKRSVVATFPGVERKDSGFGLECGVASKNYPGLSRGQNALPVSGGFWSWWLVIFTLFGVTKSQKSFVTQIAGLVP